MTIYNLESDIFDNPQDHERNKLPFPIIDRIYAFFPNRDTKGATSYFIVEKEGNILLDCPIWDEVNQQFLLAQGGVKWLLLTHKGAISPKIGQIQKFFNCEVIIQEQEAYLLPEVKITSFENEYSLRDNIYLMWTPGHSAGCACLYYGNHGGILFSGRHLLPNQQGNITPLRTAKTFHWGRQLASVQTLLDRFSPQTLSYIIPGANTGYLRGQGFVEQAYQQLLDLDLVSLRQIQAWY